MGIIPLSGEAPTWGDVSLRRMGSEYLQEIFCRYSKSCLTSHASYIFLKATDPAIRYMYYLCRPFWELASMRHGAKR